MIGSILTRELFGKALVVKLSSDNLPLARGADYRPKPLIFAARSTQAKGLDPIPTTPFFVSTLRAPPVNPQSYMQKQFEKLARAISSTAPADAVLMIPGTLASGTQPFYRELETTTPGKSLSLEGVGATSSIAEGFTSRIIESDDYASLNVLLSAYLATSYISSWLFDAGMDSVSQKVDEAYKKVQGIIELHLRDDPNASFNLTVIGHSRGAVASLQLLQRIREEYPADKYPNFKLTLLALDPVAGPLEHQEYSLPEGTKAIVTRHLAEERGATFPPLSITGASPDDVTEIFLPTIHSQGLEMRPDPVMKAMMVDIAEGLTTGKPFPAESYQGPMSTMMTDLVTTYHERMAELSERRAGGHWLELSEHGEPPPILTARDHARRNELDGNVPPMPGV